MQKVLSIEFTPRDELSLTKMLREYFFDLIKDDCLIERVDLGKNLPPLMGSDMLMAYYKRNYLNEFLTTAEESLLSVADQYRDQLFQSNILVLSFPMYNFGLPAPIKCWIDLVMQKNYAYEVGHNGHIPKLGFLKVLIIYTAGIPHDQINRNYSWNSIENCYVELFRYMGAQSVRSVNVQGVNTLTQEAVAYRTEQIAKSKLNELAFNWFNVDRGLLFYPNLKNKILSIEKKKSLE